MSIYTTEAEQIEQFKKWWQNYGKLAIALIIFICLCFWSWIAWQQKQESVAMQASAIYQELLDAAAGDKNDIVQQRAMILQQQYSQTPYASLAILILAKHAILKQDFKTAVQYFDWVLAHTKISTLRQMARLNKARVLLTEQQAQQAMDVLKIVDDSAYNPWIFEVRGDTYLALNQPAEAYEAYTEAVNTMSQVLPGFDYSSAKLKRDDLIAYAKKQ